jgi:hypothetical protein
VYTELSDDFLLISARRLQRFKNAVGKLEQAAQQKKGEN